MGDTEKPTREVPRYRKIYPLLWSDRDFGSLCTEGKLVALYILCGDQANRVGFYSLSFGLASERTGIDPDTFRIRFAKVCKTMKWRFDEAAKVVLIPNWWRWNPPENPKVLIGNLKDLLELPKTKLFKDFANNTAHLPPNLCDTFRERITIRLAYQEQEQEQEQEPSKSHSADAGEAKEAAPFRQFTDFFCEQFQKHRGTAYPFAKSKDGSAAGRVWKACNSDLDKAKRITLAYFATNDPFYEEQGYTLAYLSTKLAKFLSADAKRNGVSNADVKHDQYRLGTFKPRTNPQGTSGRANADAATGP